jgi:hypothetical protein
VDDENETFPALSLTYQLDEYLLRTTWHSPEFGQYDIQNLRDNAFLSEAGRVAFDFVARSQRVLTAEPVEGVDFDLPLICPIGPSGDQLDTYLQAENVFYASADDEPLFGLMFAYRRDFDFSDVSTGVQGPRLEVRVGRFTSKDAAINALDSPMKLLTRFELDRRVEALQTSPLRLICSSNDTGARWQRYGMLLFAVQELLFSLNVTNVESGAKALNVGHRLALDIAAVVSSGSFPMTIRDEMMSA